MFSKLTTKEIRNILFDPDSYGLDCITEELLEVELFERTGEQNVYT